MRCTTAVLFKTPSPYLYYFSHFFIYLILLVFSSPMAVCKLKAAQGEGRLTVNCLLGVIFCWWFVLSLFFPVVFR